MSFLNTLQWLVMIFESSDEDDLDSMLDKLSKDAEEDDKDDSKSDAKTVKDKRTA